MSLIFCLRNRATRGLTLFCFLQLGLKRDLETSAVKRAIRFAECVVLKFSVFQDDLLFSRVNKRLIPILIRDLFLSQMVLSREILQSLPNN